MIWTCPISRPYSYVSIKINFRVHTSPWNLIPQNLIRWIIIRHKEKPFFWTYLKIYVAPGGYKWFSNLLQHSHAQTLGRCCFVLGPSYCSTPPPQFSERRRSKYTLPVTPPSFSSAVMRGKTHRAVVGCCTAGVLRATLGLHRLPPAVLPAVSSSRPSLSLPLLLAGWRKWVGGEMAGCFFGEEGDVWRWPEWSGDRVEWRMRPTVSSCVREFLG